MSEEVQTESGVSLHTGTPFRVRLPRFIKDEEIGLGDAIKQVTYAFGLAPCGGCEQRATTLNRWIVLTR
jgi:hypothetical protein